MKATKLDLVLSLAAFILISYSNATGEVQEKKADRIQLSSDNRGESESFEVYWEVISGGATDAVSENFEMKATLGQTAVGPAESESFRLSQGYWQDFGSANCCNMPGDANDDDVVNILDITYLISFLYKGGPQPPCLYEGDANGGCTTNILDVTYLIAYLYKGGPSPICADDCPGW